MTLAELIAEFRLRADDTVFPYHVEDAALARWASEAEREACLRARLLFDTTTPTFTVFDVAANATTIQLPAEIDVIDAATFTPLVGGRASSLRLTGIEQIREHTDCDTVTTSRPFALAHLPPNQARLFPAPAAAGTLTLHVYRLPIYAMEDGDDEPEIALVLHDGLIEWMLYRAFGVKDSELNDPPRSAQALAAFTARFGERKSADVSRRHNERRPVTTTFQRF